MSGRRRYVLDLTDKQYQALITCATRGEFEHATEADDDLERGGRPDWTAHDRNAAAAALQALRTARMHVEFRSIGTRSRKAS